MPTPRKVGPRKSHQAAFHTIDPITGFTNTKGNISLFDSNRKQDFLKLYMANGLSLYKTCDQMGLSYHTVFNHLKIDTAFKAAIEASKREYAARLDGISKQNAMDPKSVIERIFQLKALFPEIYAENKRDSAPQITINFDANLLQAAKQRENIIDVTPENENTSQSTTSNDSNAT